MCRSQYVATSIIKYSSNVNNMFALENYTHNFCRHSLNVTQFKAPAEINEDILIPKYNELLMDRYSNMAFLIRQITTKEHLTFVHSWNYINDHPNMANDTLWRQKMETFSAI